MAILVEAISVVVLAQAIHERFPGGWQGFKDIVPNETLCADNEIARVGFMTPDDVQAFIGKLEQNGLVFLRDDQSVDIAVVDQMRGPTKRCPWLEFGRIPWDDDGHEVAACRLVNSKSKQLVLPLGWAYEGSLSASFGFQPTTSGTKGLQFLRHEDGKDVYLNLMTGKEVFVGRTGET